MEASMSDVEKCPKCEGYGYDIFPEVDCDACGGKDLGKSTVEQDVLRVVDSCGGADATDQSADWNRGYNDALAVVEREMKRYFAKAALKGNQ
jgi:DnaJ-class molecular chaperone